MSFVVTSIRHLSSFFFFNDTATTEIYTLSLHDALPISTQKHSYAKPSPSLSPAHISPAPSSCRLQEPRFFENAAPRHERKTPGHSQAPAPWNSLVVLRPAKTHELSGRYHHEKLFRDKKCKSRRHARRGCLVSRQLRPGMAG